MIVSWESGNALSALLDHLYPGSINYDTMFAQNNISKLQVCINLAKQKGIHVSHIISLQAYLDAEDIAAALKDNEEYMIAFLASIRQHYSVQHNNKNKKLSRWMDAVLTKKGKTPENPVNIDGNICSYNLDLNNGVQVAELLEQLSGENIGNYFRNPTDHQEFVQNMKIILAFLTSKNIDVSYFNPECTYISI